MKRIGSLLFLLLSLTEAFAQRYGRGRGGGSYDGPLPSSDEVGMYFLYAVGLLGVGYVLLKASDLFKADGKETTTSTNVGCFATLFFPAAIFCLIPLLMWMQIIVNSIFAVVVVGFIALFVLSLIWSAMKK